MWKFKDRNIIVTGGNSGIGRAIARAFVQAQAQVIISLAFELAPRGIRVNAISPGWIQTDNTLPDAEDMQQAAWAKQTSLLGRMGHPDEIASDSLYSHSFTSSYLTSAKK